MSNTYTWKINSLKVNPNLNGESNVVLGASCTVTGTDGINIATLNFDIDIPYFSSNSFIPFNQLTESQIISWVQNQFENAEPASSNLSGISAIKFNIDNQLINIQINLITSPKLPWA